MDKYLEEKFRLHEPSWQAGYPLFSAVINQHHLEKGVEIGVAFGGHSEAILKQTQVKKLYSVDMYRNDPKYDDPLNYTQPQFDELYEFTKNRLAAFGERCELLRMDSGEALSHTPDVLDFVYIDADHSYQGVWRDLCRWAKKIRVGGIIGGHDYGHVNFPGVKQAIDEFFQRFSWAIHEEGEGVWWVEKRAMPLSFIVPAYNCSGTLPQTVASIFAGNLDAMDEIIIVDDSSTDDTPRIIAQLKESYANLRVFTHPINKGTAAASRNTGIENASNPLIFCIDSDNVLASNSIPALKKHLFDTGADAAAFGELRYFTDTTSNVTHKWIFKEHITFADALAGHHWPGPSGNYLFTKESWLRAGRYFEPSLENQTLDSWTFAIRQLGTGSKMVTLPNSWYYHRYGHSSHYVLNKGKGNQSLAALIGIIPFLETLDQQSIDYIFSQRGRFSWFENIEKHPLSVKSHHVGVNGKVEIIQENKQLFVQMKHSLRKFLKRLNL